MKITVCQASLKDWKAIQKIGMTVFKSSKKYDSALDLNWPISKAGREYYKKALSSKDNCRLIGRLDGVLAGL